MINSIRLASLLLAISLMACNNNKANDIVSVPTSAQSLTIPKNDITFDSYKLAYDTDGFNFLGIHLLSHDISISFDKLTWTPNSGGSNGNCNYQANSSGVLLARYILIDSNYWAASSATGKKLLLYHELTHCLLSRDHLTTTLNGNPMSIMNPIEMSDNLFLSSSYYYLNELFTHSYLYDPQYQKLWANDGLFTY